MKWFSRRTRTLPSTSGEITVVKPRDKFSYNYRGFRIELRPIGLKHSSTLGRYGATTHSLTHEQKMSLPYALKYHTYSDDIGSACAHLERNIDRIIAFLDLDRAHTAESLQRISEFAAVDRRFR